MVGVNAAPYGHAGGRLGGKVEGARVPLSAANVERRLRRDAGELRMTAAIAVVSGAARQANLAVDVRQTHPPGACDRRL
jgi:hypothetical protein